MSASALALLFSPTPAHAQVASTTDQKISYYAEKYEVSEDKFRRTVMCESAASTTIQSLVPDEEGPNGQEDSWGIAQIHLPDHPEISKEEALDPDFSLDYMAKVFAKGEAVRKQMWGCYRALYK